MTAALPQSATSQVNRSALPDSWVERIFSHMSAMYGSKFADFWRMSNLDEVKALWAKKLGGFAGRPEIIRAALESLDARPYPPNLPEFLELCREEARRNPGDQPKALGYTPTEEDWKRAKEAMQEAKKAVEPNHVSRDYLAWARNPKSELARREVLKLAQTDSRFKEIVEGWK